MPPQVRAVAGDPSASNPAATFRADARLRLWGAAACATLAIVFTMLAYSQKVPPVVAGPVAAAFVLWSAYLAITYAARRAVRYSLSAQRLEIERGVLGKRCESIELWRIRDVVLEQTLFERLRGVGRITVFSSDQIEPTLEVGPVADARRLYERMRDRVAAARKEANVLPLDAPSSPR